MALLTVVIATAVMHAAGAGALPAGSRARAPLAGVALAGDSLAGGSLAGESLVRAPRAAPENFHKSYSSDGDGEIGYSRKKEGGGKKGYQHFDSFHKKAGDNYEFEKQDSFGLDDEGSKGAQEHEHEREHEHDDEGAYSDNNERRADSYREPESENIDEHPHKKPAKKQKGRHQHEELKEGASDGNGGVEAYGHNPDDYVLPDKYTYGSGEEYNF